MATLAKTAAEKALETAQAQAALAVAEANKATEAAGNGMHLMHVEGRTYQRGDTTITAGPGNNRSTVRNLLTGTKVITTTATEKVIAAAEGDFLQSEVPSADGSARLTLIDKYAAPKKATVFANLGKSNFASRSTVGVGYSRVTEEDPHGSIGFGNNRFKIERESGEFYQVFGLATSGSGSTSRRYPRLSASNLSSLKVNASVKDAVKASLKDVNADEYTGIYYFIPTAQVTSGTTGLMFAANQKHYLIRRGEMRNELGRHEISFDYISILEDVTFPVATPYEYMNYGTWVSWKDGKPSDLGIGFVQPLSDNSMTPLAEMPSTGMATYKGVASTHIRAAHAQGKGDISHEYIVTETTAHFARNTIQVDLDTLGNLEGSIDGNGFSGSKISGVTHSALTSGAAFQVEAFRGAFFGPGAEEVGGVFDVTSEGGERERSAAPSVAARPNNRPLPVFLDSQRGTRSTFGSGALFLGISLGQPKLSQPSGKTDLPGNGSGAGQWISRFIPNALPQSRRQRHGCVRMQGAACALAVAVSALPAAVLAAAPAPAGCGSGSTSSGNNMPDPTPPQQGQTDLEKAKQGARTASQMARQQSDEATRKADEADQKVEGILLIRTGGMAREHAIKARQAADEARKAYGRPRRNPAGPRDR